MASKKVTGFGAGGFGKATLGGSATKKTDPLAAVLASNAKSRADLAALGQADPTAVKSPSFLDRLLGVVDAPATGIRAIVHNLVDQKAPVDILGEMGKSLSGQKRVEGADIVGDMGVDNPWAKMGLGLVADVVLDPITWASLGYSTAVKAAAKDAIVVASHADFGYDAAKMATEADRVMETAKAVEASGAAKDAVLMLTSQASGLQTNANIIQGAAKFFSPELADALSAGNEALMASKPLQHELVKAVAKSAAESLGEQGGLKMFGKTIIPMQGAIDDVAGVVRNAYTASPLSTMFDIMKPAATAGEVAKIVTKGAVSEGLATENMGRVLGDHSQSLLEPLPQEIRVNAGLANEAVLDAGQKAELGQLFTKRNGLTVLQGKADDAIVTAQEALVRAIDKKKAPSVIDDLTVHLEQLGRTQERIAASHAASEQTIQSFLSDALGPQGQTGVERARQFLQGAVSDPAAANDYIDRVMPAVGADLQVGHAVQRAKGMTENTLLGPYLKQLGIPEWMGYFPHTPEFAQAPKEGLLDTLKRGVTQPFKDAGLVEQGADTVAAGSSQSPAAQDLLAQLGLSDNALMQRSAAKGVATGNAQLQRDIPSMGLEAWAKDKNLIPQLDAASVIPAKIGRDFNKMAEHQMRETAAAGTGKLLAPGMNPSAGNDVITIVRKGAELRYEVPAGVKQTVESIGKVMTDDESVKGALRAFDKAQTMWKKLATRYNVAQYNLRNKMWNPFLMSESGGLQPLAWAEGNVYYAGKALGRDMSSMTVNLGKDGVKSMDDVVKLATIGGGAESQFLYDVSKREGAKLASTVGQKVDRTVSSIAFTGENADRVAAWIAFKRKGLTDLAAGQATKDALIDFSPELKTAFEKNVAARLIPFYSWMKGNISKQAMTLLTDPGKVTWLSHLQQTGRTVNPVDESVAPDYLGHLLGVNTPLKDANGNTIVWNTNSPLADLNLFGAKPNELLSQLTPLLRTPMELIVNKSFYYNGPVSNYPGDARKAPGYVTQFDNLVHGIGGDVAKQWDAFKHNFGIVTKVPASGAPYLAMDAYALKAITDLNPWMNNVGKLMDNQSKTPYDQFALATGIKPIVYDTKSFASQKAYSDQTALQDILTMLRSQGKVPAKKPATDPLTKLLGGK